MKSNISERDLERYLNDHLAGSSGAILMIQHFLDVMEIPEAREFFVELKTAVEADRALLEKLLSSAGMSRSGFLNVAGDITARIGFFKLRWEGFKSGHLGMFEGLEMIALGIQGKRLLWVTLKEIACWFPEWKDIDFAKLESDAIFQRDGVELWRIEAARGIFPSATRRAALSANGVVALVE
jgi:hypothetical protein